MMSSETLLNVAFYKALIHWKQILHFTVCSEQLSDWLQNMLALWWRKKCVMFMSVWHDSIGKARESVLDSSRKKRLTVNYVRVLKLSTLCKYKSLGWHVQHNAGGGIKKSFFLALGFQQCKLPKMQWNEWIDLWNS